MLFDMKAFGVRVKQLRKGHHLTQEQLSEMLHISVSHLGKIEIGYNTPSIELIPAMAEFFGVNTDYAIECIQTDNGFEFTNRLANSKKPKLTLFEKTLEQLGIRHKLIKPYTPKHNGKVERSHRKDNEEFYAPLDFSSI